MTRQGNRARADIGIIGGSGLYDVEGLRKVKELSVKTPFGAPSDTVLLGELDGNSYRLSLAAWTRPPGQSLRNQLSCEYLCPKVAGCSAGDFCQRSRQHEGVDQAW